MQLTKIIWEEALNAAKSKTNKSEEEQQVQIIMQLKKSNHHYLKTRRVHPALNQFKNK